MIDQCVHFLLAQRQRLADRRVADLDRIAVRHAGIEQVAHIENPVARSLQRLRHQRLHQLVERRHHASWRQDPGRRFSKSIVKHVNQVGPVGNEFILHLGLPILEAGPFRHDSYRGASTRLSGGDRTLVNSRYCVFMCLPFCVFDCRHMLPRFLHSRVATPASRCTKVATRRPADMGG